MILTKANPAYASLIVAVQARALWRSSKKLRYASRRSRPEWQHERGRCGTAAFSAMGVMADKFCRGATFDLRKVWYHWHHWN